MAKRVVNASLFVLLMIASCLLVATGSVQACDDDDETDTATRTGDTPVELGRVNWNRDLEQAKRESARSGRPVLVLFQEVPGCQTCQDFGHGPLSHPLVTEAMETEFIPVLVYNNKPGQDETILRSFREPSWNNPVIRYLDANGKDVIERRDRLWSTVQTSRRMAEALASAGRTVPEYLKLVGTAETVETDIQQATFAMHCYWEGEAHLGSLAGILETESTWFDDKETVTVTYDPGVLNYERLVKSAKEMECASNVYAHTDEQLQAATAQVGDAASRIPDGVQPRRAKDSDQKYYLINSKYAYLPLTGLQRVRVNSALGHKKDPAEFLSPGQAKQLERIESALSADKNALSELAPPNDQQKLATYSRRLNLRLDEMAKKSGQ